MKPLVYEGIKQSQIEAMVTELTIAGSSVQNQGSGTYVISGHGIKATACFDLNASTLSVTVNSKPFYVPMSAIENGLDNALGEKPE